jgi:hypothetical protein
MNKFRLVFYLAVLLLLVNGCLVRHSVKDNFDPNYITYLDTSQSYFVGEVFLDNPLLILNNRQGSWLIVEEKNLENIVLDKNYLNRQDVFLYDDLYGFYAGYTIRQDKDLKKVSKNIFLDENMLKDPKIEKKYDDFHGFRVFKFQCDTLQQNSDLRFILGFISINRYNKLNNSYRAYQFKSDNYNIEFRKIIYPFCVYKKQIK